MSTLQKPALAAMLGLLLAACGGGVPNGDEPAATPATPVRAVHVESAAVIDQVRTVGLLAPRDEVKLSFKVGGVVERIAVDVGDTVRSGQVLATLKRAEVDAGVRQSSEGLEKARRDLERGRQLRVDEVATLEQVQDLETAYNMARANAAAVQFNARYARIEAPADGIVLQRYGEADEMVAAGQPVVVLGVTGSGWVVRSALADRDLVRVGVGDQAAIEFDAFPGHHFNGRVTRVASAADPRTGTFEVEIEVAAEGARFVRGLVARVRLDLQPTATADSRTMVPVSALVDANGDGASVFVLDATQSVVRRQQVSIGALVGDRVIVLAGLAAGDQVVTDGAAWLVDGKSVRIVDDRG